ncbi:MULTISPECIES: SAM-dependent methyltransferase [unclassified Sphingopyxis]|uniref:class I SAM-dependent methyltransferase n=1 Tax=unclassified Sphingopyxis TaxID=2614943 RepID=UPI0024ADC42F|nr:MULTISPECIES: SAM-dependent methyltransferase [unclassified Sphingopyxis]
MPLPDGPPAPEQLLKDIAAARPMTVADYMAAANAHYYATRDPLGAAGDFTTAPEISQMFGELVGIWIADLWSRAGGPPFRYVELGPGRGTLAADALRAAARFGCTPVGAHLVETSPTLRAVQSARLAQAEHHDEVDALPDDVPLVIVANEFFDALPVHQYVKTADGWRERMVERRDGRLAPRAGETPADDAIPAVLRDRPEGTIVETTPVSAAIMQRCAFRITRQGGAMLAIDYGYAGPAAGDTLQAVKAHKYVDPFVDPGEADLTAHVDFTTLADAARPAGVTISRLATQGDWLRRLGIDARLKSLTAAAPDRAAELESQRDRLVEPGEMGELFKLIAITAPGWPAPAGFSGDPA